MVRRNEKLARRTSALQQQNASIQKSAPSHPWANVMRRNGQQPRQARRRSGQWRDGSRCCYGWRHAKAWREKPEFKRPGAGTIAPVDLTHESRHTKKKKISCRYNKDKSENPGATSGPGHLGGTDREISSDDRGKKKQKIRKASSNKSLRTAMSERSFLPQR